MSETTTSTPAADNVRADLEAAFETAEKSAPTERSERGERAERAERPAPRERAPAPRQAAAEPEPAEPTEQPADQLVPPEGDRPRDQFGRFLSKTQEASAEPAEQVAPASEQTTDQPAPRESEPASPAIAAPTTWSAVAKDQWGQLPRAIQDEVLKRESDVARGFQQRAEQINALEPIAQAVAPYAQKFNLRGVSPAAAVQQLLAVQDLLERNPIEGIAHVARSYGVDLRQFAAAFEQAQQPQDPQVQAVSARVERMEGFLRQQNQAVQQAEFSRISSEVETFRADTAAHPYFDAVRPAMAQLMANNMAMTLQDAYDHACWAIPEVRSRILDDQKRAENTTRAKAERETTERARRAAVSVSSAPTSGRTTRGKEGKSIRDDLEAAFERVAQS
jgi:hypothetical protein